MRNEGLDALRKIKVVWHQPNGKRVVGVYSTNNARMKLLDFAQY